MYAHWTAEESSRIWQLATATKITVHTTDLTDKDGVEDKPITYDLEYDVLPEETAEVHYFWITYGSECYIGQVRRCAMFVIVIDRNARTSITRKSRTHSRNGQSKP